MKKFMKKLKGDKADDAPTQSTPTQSQPPSTTQTAAASQPGGSFAAGEAAKGVLLTTTLGDITIALYSDETPKVRI